MVLFFTVAAPGRTCQTGDRNVDPVTPESKQKLLRACASAQFKVKWNDLFDWLHYLNEATHRSFRSHLLWTVDAEGCELSSSISGFFKLTYMWNGAPVLIFSLHVLLAAALFLDLSIFRGPMQCRWIPCLLRLIYPTFVQSYTIRKTELFFITLRKKSAIKLQWVRVCL